MTYHFANNLSKLEPYLVRSGNYESDGVEYPVFKRRNPTHGRADVFAADSKGGLVVVECKLETATYCTVGQIAAYVGALRERFPKSSVRIRAFIVCRTVSPLLWYAVRELPNIKVSVFTYDDDRSVTRVKSPLSRRSPSPQT
jgi:RecB family endonuclease NucS